MSGNAKFSSFAPFFALLAPNLFSSGFSRAASEREGARDGSGDGQGERFLL